jgi:hypothetical protein
MDLGFDHHAGTAGGDCFRRRPDLGQGFGGDFERDGHAVLGEQPFGLVFVYVHRNNGVSLKTIIVKNQSFKRKKPGAECGVSGGASRSCGW